MKYRELVETVGSVIVSEIRSSFPQSRSFAEFCQSDDWSSSDVKDRLIMIAQDAIESEYQDLVDTCGKSSADAFVSCSIEDDGSIFSKSENIHSSYREFKSLVVSEVDKWLHA